MGHDEDKNSFDAGAAKPITSQPRTNITGNNRLGMRSGRNISAAQAELDRISADSNPNAVPSTATGDIVLNNPAPKGKKSPKIIILAILVVLAVVAAVVSVVVTNGNNGGNGGSGNGGSGNDESASDPNLPVETAKESFNEYYHYLIDKTNSKNNISQNDIDNNMSYLDVNTTAVDSNEYLTELDKKYRAFISDYGKTVGAYSPENMQAYFYGYHKIQGDYIGLDLIGKYREVGIDGAKNYLYESITPLNDVFITNTTLDSFVEATRNMGAKFIELVSIMDGFGCIQNDNTISARCNYLTDENARNVSSEYEQYVVEANELSFSLKTSAYVNLRNVYYEIYGISENSGDTE